MELSDLRGRRLRVPPNVMIVGAQKAGTTSLHEWLRQADPDTSMSQPKELHFFDHGGHVDNGRLARYERHFQPASVRGESTPIYLFYPGALERIKATYPNMKIVVVLRNPVTRAYSHYWHEVRIGWERLPYLSALERSPKDVDDTSYLRHYSYVERGLYSGQIGRALDLFGSGNVLICKFEQMLSDPVRAVNDVLQFVDPSVRPIESLQLERQLRGGMPSSWRLVRAVSRMHEWAGTSIVPGRVMNFTMRGNKYPAMSAEEYAVTRDLILAKDEGVLDYYPELAKA